ncbi:conserved hypothetical protein [Shewanella sediminis HAW-EB3]|uniref:Uncharacterized protein n=1 Tax=Shewanella sediminis (strain HAW-EB3) TaxID=425104 RepID=A8FRK6_SHESH|nr:hypothetical protein [Shewanella sediminis]ABV35479.1 conserved hypothetical protein [Shewanella sediminis HAW-EB3]
MHEQLKRLLAPYVGVTLSAFDNLKLVVSVLSAEVSANHSSEEPPELKPVAYEAQRKSDVGLEVFYCVKWQGVWIDCGRINDYAASPALLSCEEESEIEMSSLRELNVPVMTMQQVSFMCMESAHFDHCE